MLLPIVHPDKPQMSLLCSCVNCFNYCLLHKFIYWKTPCLWLIQVHPYYLQLMDFLAIHNLLQHEHTCVPDSTVITVRCIRLLFMLHPTIHRHLLSRSTYSLLTASQMISVIKKTLCIHNNQRLTCFVENHQLFSICSLCEIH